MVLAFLLGLAAGTAVGILVHPILVGWVAAREHAAASTRAAAAPRVRRVVLPSDEPPPRPRPLGSG